MASEPITTSEGIVIANVADGTIDVTATSLAMYGTGSLHDGSLLNDNFFSLLENFASTHPPSAPLKGQAWYDSANEVVKIWDGSGWLEISGTFSAGAGLAAVMLSNESATFLLDNSRVLAAFCDKRVLQAALPETVKIGSMTLPCRERFPNGISPGLTLAGEAHDYYFNGDILLSNSGVTRGTYNRFSVNAKGLVTGGVNYNDLPLYAIVIWPYPLSQMPAGFYVCDGSLVMCSDGSSVTVPDLRDRFVIGADEVALNAHTARVDAFGAGLNAISMVYIMKVSEYGLVTSTTPVPYNAGTPDAPIEGTSGTMVFDTPGTYTFTVPTYYQMTVECWGAGGAGYGGKKNLKLTYKPPVTFESQTDATIVARLLNAATQASDAGSNEIKVTYQEYLTYLKYAQLSASQVDATPTADGYYLIKLDTEDDDPTPGTGSSFGAAIVAGGGLSGRIGKGGAGGRAFGGNVANISGQKGGDAAKGRDPGRGGDAPNGGQGGVLEPNRGATTYKEHSDGEDGQAPGGGGSGAFQKKKGYKGGAGGGSGGYTKHVYTAGTTGALTVGTQVTVIVGEGAVDKFPARQKGGAGAHGRVKVSWTAKSNLGSGTGGGGGTTTPDPDGTTVSFSQPGNWTYTIPTYTTYFTVELWGAGGGGMGSGQATATDNSIFNGENGTDTTFMNTALVAGGGKALKMSGKQWRFDEGGQGGVATGGDVNLNGNDGKYAQKVKLSYGGDGGSAPFGGSGGQKGQGKNGSPGAAPGGGGAGAYGYLAGAGGGGGAYVKKRYAVGDLAPGTIATIVVGEGGKGGEGKPYDGYNGGDGAVGAVKITYF